MKTEYERWASKVQLDEKTNCWEWKGAKYRKGYGHFRRFINGKWGMEKAHRFSYEYFNEVTKDSMNGLVVCHTCDNPSCVNPEHLFIGTYKDNIQDCISKDRHSFGINPNHNKLSFQIAEEIRKFKQLNPNLMHKDIATLFNTSTAQVCRILNNLIWKKTSKGGL